VAFVRISAIAARKRFPVLRYGRISEAGVTLRQAFVPPAAAN
jgi:hypothetical protein